MNKKNIMIITNRYNYNIIKRYYEKILSCIINPIYELKKEDIKYIDIENDYIKYKINLFIKGLDKGCNVIIDYDNNSDSEYILYILKKLNYEFEYYNLTNNIFKDFFIFKKICNINIIKYFTNILKLKISLKLFNNLQKYIRRNIGFEINKGSFDRINKLICNNGQLKDLIINYYYYLNRLKNIPIDKPKKCYKIALISNYFIPDKIISDYTIETILSRKNIQCDRYDNNILNSIKNNIYKKYDGILFIKTNTISDEITYMIINSICNKEKISILFINYNNDINEYSLENNINVLRDIICFNKKQEKI